MRKIIFLIFCLPSIIFSTEENHKDKICSDCSRIIDMVYHEKNYPILPLAFDYFSFYKMTDEQRIHFNRGRLCMYLEMINKYDSP